MNCVQLRLFPGPGPNFFTPVVHMLPQGSDRGKGTLWKTTTFPYELHRFDTGKPALYPQVTDLL